MKKTSSEQQSRAGESERTTRKNKENEAVQETRGKERKLTGNETDKRDEENELRIAKLGWRVREKDERK